MMLWKGKVEGKNTVTAAATTDKTIALGTSLSGFCTSSHMEATIPYPVSVYADWSNPTKNAHPEGHPEVDASKLEKTNLPERLVSAEVRSEMRMMRTDAPVHQIHRVLS